MSQAYTADTPFRLAVSLLFLESFDMFYSNVSSKRFLSLRDFTVAELLRSWAIPGSPM